MMNWTLLVLVLSVVHWCLSRHHHHRNHLHQQQQHHARQMQSLQKEDAVNVPLIDNIFTSYNKHHPGRHVCTNQRNITLPVKTKQSYCKPTYKKYQQRCNDNQLCTAVRVIYETAYRDVVTTKLSKQTTYACCPGWKQLTNRSHGCNKPLCNNSCHNGGSCVKPDTCSCQKGYQGRLCEFDVDECKEEKPCDQICINTLGTYKCECRENFTLGEDGQTCKRDDDEPGFEAKELQFESLDKRLLTIEQMMETNKAENVKQEITEIKSTIDYINHDLGHIKNEIKDIENYKTDMKLFKTKLGEMEKASSKIDELSARYDKMRKCAFYNKICI